MRSILKNRILRTGLLGFVVLVIFLAPVSFSLTVDTHTGSGYSTVRSEINPAIANAGPIDSLGNTVFNNVGNAFLQFVSLLTRAGGVLLDTALTETVFKMGANANSSSLKPTIDNLWSLIRDICNLAFIFGFIYIGIRTIIDPDSATMKRFLSRIIIGALLINFSLFFAKAIIDFSNFTAYQVYQGMVSGTGSLTETIMNQLGVITFYDSKGVLVVRDNGFAFFLMASLFLIVTAFVFFAGALILIVRFVALILIMIASPLLFAATVFPQTESAASDLWKKLISYSFLAPIYILLVLISIKLLEGMSSSFGGRDLLAAVTGSSNVQQGVSNVGAILNFTVAIFFMISALTIATKMGGKGGEMAVGFANNLRGRMQGVIGRKFVGGASHWAREKYEKADASLGNMKGRLAPLGKAAQWTLGATGVDRSVRETLQAGEHAKFGSKYSFEDDEKYDKERKKRQANIVGVEKFKQAIQAGTAPGAAGTRAEIEMEEAVVGASTKYFEELTQEERLAIAHLMTDAAVESLGKSEELSDKEKAEIGESRKKLIKSLYTETTDNYNRLPKAGIGHLVSLGYEFLERPENAIQLTSSHMDELKKKLGPSAYKRVDEARKNALLGLATGTPLTVRNSAGAVIATKDKNHVLGQNPGEIAKMPTDIIVALADEIPIDAYESMVRDKTKTSTDAQRIFTEFYRKFPSSTSPRAMDIDNWLQNTPTGQRFGR